MGLDIYSGTLTRYYSHNWKTAVQQWAEENGYTYSVIRMGGDMPPEESPKEILEAISAWRDFIAKAFSAATEKPLLWNEDIDVTPYYTDKPDWDALNSLLLYTAAWETGEKVPPTVTKGFDIGSEPLYIKYEEKRKSENKKSALADCSGMWLPIEETLAAELPVPTGDTQLVFTAGALKAELEKINSYEWHADEKTIDLWNKNEGYPEDMRLVNGKPANIDIHSEFDTVSLAKFAFSILWKAVDFSLKYGTVIMFDS